jgi:HlyD family secretion protein
MDRRRRRKIIRNLIVAGVLAGALVVVVKVAYRPAAAPPLEATRLAPAKIVSTVTAEGELRALNQVDISAEVVAKIEKVYVQEGDKIESGQLLCVLDDDEYRSQRDLYRAELARAKAEFERGKTLFEENLLAEADFEERRTAYEVARARLEQSEDDLTKTRLYSPIAGRVVKVEVEEGETVVMGTMNNPGTVMFTVGDLSAMQAEIYVDETDVAGVALGQPAAVTLDALPDETFEALVAAVGYMPATAGDADASEVTEFEVILDLVRADARLRPGMTAQAEITTAVVENVVTCPLQALGRHEIDGKMRDTVFVLEDGRVKVTPVRVGISDGTNVEITEGLEFGRTVVTGPYKELRKLRDGDAVEAVVAAGDKGWSDPETERRKATATGVFRAMRRRR